VKEYNRLIGLINAVNRGFGVVLIVLEQQISQVEMKAGWLAYITHTGKYLRLLDGYLLEAKEPITESGLRARTEEARAETMTLDEATEFLTDEHAFAADEMVEEDGQRCASDGAWERVLGEKRKAVRAAIDTGILRATGKGARTRVAVGDLCDWAALPVPVLPEWGFEFDVRPDADEDVVRMELADRKLAQKVMRRVRPSDDWPIDPDAMPEGPDHEAFATGMAHSLAAAIVGQVRSPWAQLRAIEVVIAGVAEEFDGEDPLRPHNREGVDVAKARLQKLAHEMQEYVGEMVLPEPDESDLTQAREFLEHCDE
jgi:hypothetical protein